VDSLLRSVPVADVETLLTMNWDHNVALSITSELVVMEVINRIFICVFEVSTTAHVSSDMALVSTVQQLPLLSFVNVHPVWTQT